MYCPSCGAANVDGAKFCGSCGGRVEGSAVSATDATTQLPPSVTSPTVVRERAITPSQGMSAGSLAAPPSHRTSGKMIAVLAIDVGLIVLGLVLWTRPPTAASSPSGSADRPVGSGVQVTPLSPLGSGSGSGSGPHVVGSGSTHGSGGPATNSGSNSGPGTGSSVGSSSTGSGSGSNPSPGSGSAAPGIDAGSGPIVDARSIDDRLPDASAPTPVEVDAATATADDAAVIADAADGLVVDADLTEEVSAGVIQGQFNHFVIASNSKLSRCYQSATKGLPDDQPLRGELDIALSVMPTGETANVRIDRDTIGSQTLAACVLGVVRGWAFSPHDGDAPIQLSGPLGFGPQ